MINEENYKFGTKNNWRRTIWNEIDSRLDKNEKDLIVLGLFGEQDLDRKIAMLAVQTMKKRGILPHSPLA